MSYAAVIDARRKASLEMDTLRKAIRISEEKKKANSENASVKKSERVTQIEAVKKKV